MENCKYNLLLKPEQPNIETLNGKTKETTKITNSLFTQGSNVGWKNLLPYTTNKAVRNRWSFSNKTNKTKQTGHKYDSQMRLPCLEETDQQGNCSWEQVCFHYLCPKTFVLPCTLHMDCLACLQFAVTMCNQLRCLKFLPEMQVTNRRLTQEKHSRCKDWLAFFWTEMNFYFTSYIS